VSGTEIRTFGVSEGDVTAIDDWIERVAEQWAIDQRAAFRARLCVAELAANVLEHGSKNAADGGHIVVALRKLSDGVEVEFLDSTGAFDLTKEPETVAPRAEPGGWGLRLVRAYAKELSYVNDDGQNRVRFTISAA
jgi:anti-sigma regulatory factor (Ser/Thr protein kinase)